MSLEKFLGPVEGEEFMYLVYQYTINVCHMLIVEYSDPDYGIEEKVFLDCLRFMENHMEKQPDRKAFADFYTASPASGKEFIIH